LISSSGANLDSNGNYYLTTDTSGDFNGTYTCTVGTPLYAYALGGGSVYGSNPAIGEMAVIGTCPAYPDPFPQITMNEVTTVAAAYTMAGFALDAKDVSSDAGVSSNPTALQASTGIVNAFTNASNLVDLSTGTALTTTPVGSGGVPYQTLYSLANILASCIESSGPCTTLFSTATSNGTSTGTTATDTATAAIYIAQNPAANISTLWGLIPSSPPYTGLSAQPNDFTVAIFWVPGGGTTGSGGPAVPKGIAVDGMGNVWVTDYWTGSGNAFASELSSTGVVLASGGPSTGGPFYPQGVAIDSAGNAWVATLSGIPLSFTAEIVGLSSSGSALSTVETLTGGGLVSPTSVTFDSSGNIWAVNGNNGVSAFVPTTGSAIYTAGVNPTQLSGDAGIAADSSGYIWSTSSTYGKAVQLNGSSGSVAENVSIASTSSGLYASAVDSSGSVWISNASANSIIKVSGTGTVLSPSGGYTGGGLNTPYSIAIDGKSNAWVANPASGGTGYSSITEFSNTGTPICSSNGFEQTSTLNYYQIAVDGSGDVWVAGTGSLTEIIGAATPVVTPLATAVSTSSLGTRP
jgi:hypothetical protein